MSDVPFVASSLVPISRYKELFLSRFDSLERGLKLAYNRRTLRGVKKQKSGKVSMNVRLRDGCFLFLRP